MTWLSFLLLGIAILVIAAAVMGSAFRYRIARYSKGSRSVIKRFLRPGSAR